MGASLLMSDFVDLSGPAIGRIVHQEAMAAASAALDAGATHYTTRPGIVELRGAIADHIVRWAGRRPDPLTEVLVTCGVEEAVFVAVLTTVGAGDRLLVVGPSPTTDEELAAAAGGILDRLVLPDVHDDVSQWLCLNTRPRVGAILVRNPTVDGSPVAEPVMRCLRQCAHDQGVPLLEVKALADFLPAVHDSTESDVSRAGAAASVVIGDFSAWNLEGWRVGYVAGPSSLIGTMTDLMQALSICAPALGQYAALGALQSGEVTLAATRTVLAARAAAFSTGLSAYGQAANLRVAGQYIFVPVGGAEAGVIETLIREAGVRVEAGAPVGVPGALRVTLSEPEAVMLGAATRIAASLFPKAGEGVDG